MHVKDSEFLFLQEANAENVRNIWPVVTVLCNILDKLDAFQRLKDILIIKNYNNSAKTTYVQSFFDIILWQDASYFDNIAGSPGGSPICVS